MALNTHEGDNFIDDDAILDRTIRTLLALPLVVVLLTLQDIRKFDLLIACHCVKPFTL